MKEEQSSAWGRGEEEWVGEAVGESPRGRVLVGNTMHGQYLQVYTNTRCTPHLYRQVPHTSQVYTSPVPTGPPHLTCTYRSPTPPRCTPHLHELFPRGKLGDEDVLAIRHPRHRHKQPPAHDLVCIGRQHLGGEGSRWWAIRGGRDTDWTMELQ